MSAVTCITSPVSLLITIAPLIAYLLSSEASTVIVVVDVDATAPFTLSLRSGNSSLKFLNSGSSVDSEDPIANNALRGAFP